MEKATSVFYGDLVEAAMSKDVKRMVELMNRLNIKEMVFLHAAFAKIAVIASAITEVRKGGI